MPTSHTEGVDRWARHRSPRRARHAAERPQDVCCTQVQLAGIRQAASAESVCKNCAQRIALLGPPGMPWAMHWMFAVSHCRCKGAVGSALLATLMQLGSILQDRHAALQMCSGQICCSTKMQLARACKTAHALQILRGYRQRFTSQDPTQACSPASPVIVPRVLQVERAVGAPVVRA